MVPHRTRPRPNGWWGRVHLINLFLIEYMNKEKAYIPPQEEGLPKSAQLEIAHDLETLDEELPEDLGDGSVDSVEITPDSDTPKEIKKAVRQTGDGTFKKIFEED